jgi:hypothetical protein
MKRLLDGQFCPVTDGWGFFRTPLDEVAKAIMDWQLPPRPATTCRVFESNLAGALRRLEPMNFAPVLLGDTQSSWTVVFDGAGSWPDTIVSYLCHLHGWRGVLVDCVEDTFDNETGKGRPGGVQLTTFGGPHADARSYERVVSATNQCSQWEFHTYGPVLPFEQPERYKARRIKDRFTQEMLEGYCLALGIRLYDEDFYGPRFAVIRDEQPLAPDYPPETYESMRRARNLI